jgi:hypothetical protein
MTPEEALGRAIIKVLPHIAKPAHIVQFNEEKITSAIYEQLGNYYLDAPLDSAVQNFPVELGRELANVLQVKKTKLERTMDTVHMMRNFKDKDKVHFIQGIDGSAKMHFDGDFSPDDLKQIGEGIEKGWKAVPPDNQASQIKALFQILLDTSIQRPKPDPKPTLAIGFGLNLLIWARGIYRPVDAQTDKFCRRHQALADRVTEAGQRHGGVLKDNNASVAIEYRKFIIETFKYCGVASLKLENAKANTMRQLFKKQHDDCIPTPVCKKKDEKQASVIDKPGTKLRQASANKIKFTDPYDAKQELQVYEALVIKCKELNLVNEPSATSQETALHYAVRTKSVDKVKILMKHGADPHKADQKGVTPLAIAEKLKSDDLLCAMSVTKAQQSSAPPSPAAASLSLN